MAEQRVHKAGCCCSPACRRRFRQRYRLERMEAYRLGLAAVGYSPLDVDLGPLNERARRELGD